MAKKAAFAAASFANLRAAAGEAAGEPLRVLLVDIDLDPNQPRKRFDADALEILAETIRQKGLLQPVGVHPPAGGRYRLAFGERRYRAARLAGLADIPAVVVPEGQRDYAAQVIENQQRADLANSELAAAVNRLHAEGRTLKEIAAVCNLRDYQVSAFRAVDRLPAFLRARLDRGDMRAIYDLYRAWQKHPAEVEAALPDADAFLTVTEARRVVAAVTGKPTGSVVLDRGQAGPEPRPAAAPAIAPDLEPPPAPATLAVQGADDEPARDAPDLHRANLDAPVREAAPVAAPDLHGADRDPLPVPAGAPVFVMRTAAGVEGLLVTHERPEAPGSAFLDVGGERVETPFAELRCVSVR